MQDNVSARVFALVAYERGRNIKELEPQLTLQRDLGMDGDDAVEFLERFGREFSIDLRPLGEDWHCYFGPEGIPFRALPLFSFLVLSFRSFLSDFSHSFLTGPAFYRDLQVGYLPCLAGGISVPPLRILRSLFKI